MNKRKKENPLSIYMFKKRKEINTSDNDVEKSAFDQQCLPMSDSEIVNDNSISNASSSSEKEYQDNPSVESNLLDVGKYIGIRDKIDADLKYRLLDSPWKPEKSFIFPITDEKRKLKFQAHWFDKFPWLTYTTTGKQGALCKYCTLFAGECAGKGSHQQLKSLVIEPLNRWKNALSDFKHHNESQYHKTCLLLADNFVKVHKTLQNDIMNQLDSGRSIQIAANRKKLVPVVETIKLCGRQELALRGTSDSGPIKINEPEPEINDGNFRAILRMRNKCGDPSFMNYSENLMLNATYLSPTIQNEIITTCGEIIQKQLVQSINSAKCFSVLADETTDISRQEQMSICVRYVEPEGEAFVLREDFLTFVSVEKTTGDYLANAIISKLTNLGIDCSYLIGQGYDGASSMKGSFNGVQAVIRKSFPEAIYVHCSSHSLNLALSHSCQIKSVRNCIGIIKSVGNFFKSSAKRTNCLRRKIKENFPHKKWENLTAMCETRWVENHDGLLRFKEIYKGIFDTFEELSIDMDSETSSKATSFLRTIVDSDFVISLCCLSVLFSYTIQLCKILQSPTCDLVSALQHVTTIASTFKDMRENIESEFSSIFSDGRNLLESVDEELKIPRIVARQQHRANVDTNDPETYFRITIMIPLLDDFTSQLVSRFKDHSSILTSLYCLIPSVCFSNENLTEESFELYKKYLECDTIKAELKLWQTKWRQQPSENRPKTAIEALGECNEELYPNIHKLLKILVTLPVSTCTPERTFSTMKRLKTYLSNSTGEERLTGLALMSIHRRIDISTNEVIDLFASKKARRLNLIL